jgi:hypothetical protein
VRQTRKPEFARRKNKMNKRQITFFNSILLLLTFAFINLTAQAQTTAFTYQGKLSDNNATATGIYEMQFRLFDNPNAGQGTQQGATVTNPTVQVTDGIFTVALNFGAANFAAGANLYLELSIRPAGSGGGYTSLAPRQQITSAPYAVRSLNAATADNALNLGGTAANQFVQTNDARLSDNRNPTAGSENYIQNTNLPQTAANFNIGGNGVIGGDLTVGGSLSLNVVNAQSHFSIDNLKVFSAPNDGTNNVFVGIEAGRFNTTGYGNSFVGGNSGYRNIGGYGNSFFGTSSGYDNQTGTFNSFFGHSSGSSNESGSNNSFFGVSAGNQSVSGDGNSFFGRKAGLKSNGGSNNTFIGFNAGEDNRDGGSNTIIGYNANVASGSLVFATALGAESAVSASDTVVIGKQSGVYNNVIRSADKVIIPGTLQIDTLGTTGGTPLCRNGGNRISACSASLVDGNKLQSFSTEIKNQQMQIEQQQKQIEQQQILIDELKKLVCQTNAQAAVCK